MNKETQMFLKPFRECMRVLDTLSYGYEPTSSHVKAKLSKGEKKKCKSCRYYHHQKNIYCYCEKGQGGYKGITPMSTACEHYQKKK